jgi:Fe-S-cluster containining protein
MEELNKTKHHPENTRLCEHVKTLKSVDLDLLVHGIATEETNKIDCTECGNCCSKLQPPFTHSDIEKIVATEGITEDKLKNKFLVLDAKNQIHYLKTSPCSFLCDKKCTIYLNRPQACSDYPHLHQAHFKYRLKSIFDNYEICPIVYNTVERLKIKLGIC